MTMTDPNPLEVAVAAWPDAAVTLLDHFRHLGQVDRPEAALHHGYAATLADPSPWPHPALVGALRASEDLSWAVIEQANQQIVGDGGEGIDAVRRALALDVLDAFGVLQDEELGRLLGKP